MTGAAAAVSLAAAYDRVAARLVGRERELARLGHGRLRRIRAYTDVAPALGAIFPS